MMRKTTFFLLFIILIISVEAVLPTGWKQTNANTITDNTDKVYTKNAEGRYMRSDAQYTYFYNPASNQQLVMQNSDKAAVKIITYSGPDRGTYTSTSGDYQKFVDQTDVYVKNNPLEVKEVPVTGPTTPSTAPKLINVNTPTGVTAPAGGGGAAGGAAPTEYSYVVGPSGYMDPSTGQEYKENTVLTYDQPLTGQALQAVTSISPEQKKFTDTNAGQYTYNSDGSFSVTTPPNFAYNPLGTDYNTVTTMSVAKDGTITTEQKTYVCRGDITDCDKVPIPASLQKTTVTPGGTDKEGKPVPGSKTTTIYDVNGREQARLVITYNTQAVKPADRSRATSITIDNGQPANLESGRDNPNYRVYYVYNPATGFVYDNIDAMPVSSAEKDKNRAAIVGTGELTLGAALKTLTTLQTLGRWMKGYYDYQGLRQLSGLFWPNHAADVKAKQDKIKRQFCLAAGIANCITSQICEHSYDLDADNIVSGRGPGGQYVSSAVLNAESTPAIEVSGMTRQQLIDLFGNTTVISGRLFNLADPAFNPKVLGKIKIRLYHVQYSVRNNGLCKGGVAWGGTCEQEDLTYDIHFVRVDKAYNSSYAAPLVDARWFAGQELPKVKYLESAKDDLYKFSATEYSSVCLEFSPKLPSGNYALTGDLCVPFQDSITPTAAAGAPGAAPTTGIAGTAPGASI